MFGLGPQEIIGILFVVLVLFGAKRLPELARSMGQGVKEFRKSVREITEEVDTASTSTGSGAATPTNPSKS